MIKDLLKNTDFLIVICVLALVIIGIVGIYSAGYSTDVNKDEYIKQMIFFGIGFVILLVLYLIPNYVFEFGGYVIYSISLILLIAVLFTPKIMGAHSWFNLGGFLYQPSELMKIGYILTFSKFITMYKKMKTNKVRRLIIIGLLCLSFALPVGLIMLQPDFGTAVVFLFITFFILFKSGLKYRYIFIALGLIIVMVPIVYYGVLNDTQKARIDVFLDPTIDPLGSGYNAIQSELAVGSGMFFGTGFLQGVQTQMGFIPIKTSDFIYSVLSEEFGFVMSFIIVVLFTILIIRIINVSKYAEDEYLSLVVIGIAGMLFFHFVQNIGMTIGFMPITGVPLPFVSYGGSSMITNMISLGIILNVCARKQKNILF